MIAQPLAFRVRARPTSAFVSRNKICFGPDHGLPRSLETLSIPTGTASPEEALQLLLRVYEHGRNVFYAHRFWTLIAEPERRMPLFVGWVIESFHFVGSAPKRMTQSLPHQRDSRFKYLLAVHAVEEWDHDRFFVEALRLLGYPPAFIESRLPLAETDALITIMRSIARQDAFAYAAVGGFLESTRDDEANRRFNEVLVAGGAPEAAVNSVQSHEDLDRELEHRGLIEELLQAHGPVQGDDLAFAIGSVLLMVEALVDWVEAMTAHYGDGAILRFRHPAFSQAFDAAGDDIPQPIGQLEPDGDSRVSSEALAALPASAVERLRLLPRLRLNRWTPAGLEKALQAKQTSLTEFFRILLEGELCWYLNPTGYFKRQAQSDGHVQSDRLSTWRNVFEHWLQGVYGEDFWTWIQGPERSDAQITGWLLENYHYIRAAEDHMTGAASNCSEPRWRRLLASHFADEIDHYLIFGQGLQDAGVAREILVRARPLPTTAAMSARLTELALTDTVGYVLADQALQYSATVTKDTNDAFYESLMAAHPTMAPAIGAFLNHDRVDSDLGHDALFDPILNELDPFDPGLEPSIRAAGAMMATFCHYLRGIRRWYGDREWTVEERLQAYDRDDQVAPRVLSGATAGG